jgi:L-lactate utilization protein LutB
MTDKPPEDTAPQTQIGIALDKPAGAEAAREAIGARLKAFEQAEAERILSSCTRCGKCFEVCPMRVYSKAPAAGGQGEAVVGGVLAVLRGEQGSPEALGWIAVCCRSGACVPSCPEKVDPQMMMRLARMSALGGRGGEKQIAMREDPDYFNRVRAFAKLQLSDEELKRWT